MRNMKALQLKAMFVNFRFVLITYISLFFFIFLFYQAFINAYIFLGHLVIAY